MYDIETVIAQLRVGVDFVYEKHSNVTVLFSHINDFDDIAASLTAHEVVALLNTIFSSYDTLTDQWSVYKVETIGDVYLVASNCPAEYKRRDHASAICGLALDMSHDAARPRIHQLAKRHVKMKIGINSGGVIAGVVGMRCPRYRLMGTNPFLPVNKL
jgi:adenylate cyclase